MSFFKNLFGAHGKKIIREVTDQVVAPRWPRSLISPPNRRLTVSLLCKGHTRQMARKSNSIRLVAAVSSLSVIMAGCSDPSSTPAAAQETPKNDALLACVSNPKNTVQECEKYFGENAKKSAFSAKSQCEAEYGVGNCESRKADDGSDVFMPLVVGYMLGNMMSGGGNYNRYAPPPSGYYNDDDYYNRKRERERREYGTVGGSSSGYKSNTRNYNSDTSSYKSSSYSKPSSTTSYKSGGFGASAGSKGSCCS
jgi:uncharacterized protein YgiB involved in biofilm formation